MNQEIDEIESINQMNSKWRIYSRNSFDRFGDDFRELLLSYLSLKDKLVFRYVSKRWKRCLFGRQRKTTYIFIQE
jgi:hypothetical protein